MMTQPIQNFEKLTSETAAAGGDDLTKIGFAHDERRTLEMRARYARAAVVGTLVIDAVPWLGRQYRRLAAALKADFRLRAAEDQLFRMSDRELADLGLSRAEIPFAVRQPLGEPPVIESKSVHAHAANQNLRHAA